MDRNFKLDHRASLGNLPKVDFLMEEAVLSSWENRISRPLLKKAVIRTLEKLRKGVLEGGQPLPAYEDIVALADRECRRVSRMRLQRVINATGVLLHTNLGRSPLGGHLWNRAMEVNTGGCNLEMDLNTGKRGERFPFVHRLVEELTGSEYSVLVNNNAAAVFLMLSTFAQGGEVIISRGELVQIGGGFRIPEILAQSGARLVEAGTTNITTAEDYRRALNENTRMVLVVNPSNYRVRGFSSAPDLKEIKALLPPGVILAVDEGCGQLAADSPQDMTIARYFKQGADLCAFSCDKLLGGVQGGFVTGRRELVSQMRRHPLMRLFRVGKTIASLLEVRLLELCNQGSPRLPRPFTEQELSLLEERGRKIVDAVGKGLELRPSRCTIGGGSHPDETFPSRALVLPPSKVSGGTLLKKLREAEPSVVACIKEEEVFLDLAAIPEEDTQALVAILTSLLEDR